MQSCRVCSGRLPLLVAMLGLLLTSAAVPAIARNVGAGYSVELYRSTRFEDYYFFYDSAHWTIVDQSSEPGSDWIRMTSANRDIAAIYVTVEDPSLTPADCVNGFLQGITNDPALAAVENLTEAGVGGPPEIHQDSDITASVQVVLTYDQGKEPTKFAGRARCADPIVEVPSFSIGSWSPRNTTKP